MALFREKTIVSKDPEFSPRIPAEFAVHAYVDPNDNHIVDLFVAVPASTLTENTKEIRDLISARQFRILFLREDMPIEWLPEQLLKAGLAAPKLLSKVLPYSNWQVPERVINAWADDSQQVLIADAMVTTETLSVRNCALEKIEVPIAAIPALEKIHPEERGKFEITDGGSFIHWTDGDIDLDFDSLRYIADPEWQKKCDAERVLAEQGFGYAVKGIRELNNLTQAEIEARTGISERQLRRYETEGIKPRLSSLEKLAQAHGVSLNDYLDRLARAVNGPVAVIIPCENMDQQSKLCRLLSKRFAWLAAEQGRPLLLFRPKGSKEHEIWTCGSRQAADDAKEHLALAIRIESLNDFNAVREFCQEQKLEPGSAIGLDRWPSRGYVPVPTDYVLNELKGRAG